MRLPYDGPLTTDACARAEAHRVLDMADRQFAMTRHYTDMPADEPSAREARIQRQGFIKHAHHRINVLAEIGEREQSSCILVFSGRIPLRFSQNTRVAQIGGCFAAKG